MYLEKMWQRKPYSLWGNQIVSKLRQVISSFEDGDFDIILGTISISDCVLKNCKVNNFWHNKDNSIFNPYDNYIK